MIDLIDETQLRSLLRCVHLPDGTASELYFTRTQSRSVGWAEGRPSLRGASMTDAVCVRVHDRGGEGIVTARAVDADRIRRLGERAVDIARVAPKDAHRRFAEPARTYPPALPADARIFEERTEESIDRLRRMEKRILERDPRLRKVVRLHVSEERETVGVANSHGVCRVGEGSTTTFVVEVMGEEGGSTEVAWDFLSRRRAEDFPFEAVADGAAQHALESLGAAPIPSGDYPVVVDPRVGAQLLSLVAEALSAEAVQLSRSFFRGLLGKPVASAAVTLMDDPLLPNGLQSRGFDDEGMPQAPLGLVQAGVLKDYFYDLRSAERERRVSNGRGLKASLGAPPRPRHTNFFLAPGETSLEALLASAPTVFCLRDVMGLHMADPISGEFSLGAAGTLFKDGRAVQPVRGVTVAGTIGALLANITRIGSDLAWRGDIGCPSFLVSSLTVGGI